MGTRVNPPGSPPGGITTRWQELMNDTAGECDCVALCSQGWLKGKVRPGHCLCTNYPHATSSEDLLNLVNAVSPVGVDIHFLNRPGMPGVTSIAQIAPLFAQCPSGGTPMIGALQRIFLTYAAVPSRVLLLFVTDGEPSDGTYSQLFRTLQGIPQNMCERVHCTQLFSSNQ